MSKRAFADGRTGAIRIDWGRSNPRSQGCLEPSSVNTARLLYAAVLAGVRNDPTGHARITLDGRTVHEFRGGAK